MGSGSVKSSKSGRSSSKRFRLPVVRGAGTPSLGSHSQVKHHRDGTPA
jgi:hypothetical protein